MTLCDNNSSALCSHVEELDTCCTVVALIPGHIKFYAGCLWRHKSHACVSNDCTHCLGVSVHENGAADFTWVDLGTLLVDKKPKLVCLLEHIVLCLSRRIKRADQQIVVQCAARRKRRLASGFSARAGVPPPP